MLVLVEVIWSGLHDVTIEPLIFALSSQASKMLADLSTLEAKLVRSFVVSVCGGNLRAGSIRANRRWGLRHIRESDRCGQTAKIEKG
jgi:hypothetical protein